MDRNTQTEGDHSPSKEGTLITKFVILYRGPKGMGDTTEDQQRLASAWGAWYQLLGAAVVDGGHPFGVSSTITADRTTHPGAASKLTGYVIIEAPDLDVANRLARQCPALDTDIGRVEVYTALTF